MATVAHAQRFRPIAADPIVATGDAMPKGAFTATAFAVVTKPYTSTNIDRCRALACARLGARSRSYECTRVVLARPLPGAYVEGPTQGRQRRPQKRTPLTTRHALVAAKF